MNASIIRTTLCSLNALFSLHSEAFAPKYSTRFPAVLVQSSRSVNEIKTIPTPPSSSCPKLPSLRGFPVPTQYGGTVQENLSDILHSTSQPAQSICIIFLPKSRKMRTQRNEPRRVVAGSWFLHSKQSRTFFPSSICVRVTTLQPSRTACREFSRTTQTCYKLPFRIVRLRNAWSSSLSSYAGVRISGSSL